MSHQSAEKHEPDNSSNKKSADSVQIKIIRQNSQNRPADIGDNWITTNGQYSYGKVTAIVPRLSDYDPENLTYLVDVALNGQQFTGRPLNFRYYDVTITSIEPPIGPAVGGTNIKIIGRGLYDAGVKRVRILTKDGKGKREVAADWDKKLRCLRVTMPAYKWLFAEEQEQDDQEETEEKKKAPLVVQAVDIKLTLNNQEWIDALQFNYHDSEISRITYANQVGPAEATPEDREHIWNAEDPEEHWPDDMPEEERKKREDEKGKKTAEEAEEVNTVAKRKGMRIYIHGVNFKRTDTMQVRFLLDNFSPVLVKPVFKNTKLLGSVIPHMGDDVPIGQHPCVVELTLNGQQFTENGAKFTFNQVDPKMSEEELRKIEEEEQKNTKKAPLKKK
jgi:hypothetical protein